MRHSRPGTRVLSPVIGLCAALLFHSPCAANGVGILDAHNAVYLKLDSTVVGVTVQGQISTTTATQYFTNKKTPGSVTYAFPLAEQASATQLRWRVSGQWRTASIVGKPQSATLPGGGTVAANLSAYLGKTPLYFAIPQTIARDSTLIVELTYVEFLPYAFGAVTYSYPNDYRLIDTAAVLAQKLAFTLASPRSIDSLRVTTGQTPESLSNSGNQASVRLSRYEAPASASYGIRYVLNAAQLGLFAYSSRLPDSTVPDTLGRFMTFVAEPDPGQGTATIAKVFTLIVDCSGSMLGTKMTQAKNAATYIVQNLNEGDRFNVVRFASAVSGFRPGHVAYTAQSRDSALAYISQLAATDNTNISGAFDFSVPQFQASNDSTANIVIFMTDGQPTVGITDIPALTAHIDSLILASEKRINLFSFGIGTDANQQLLTLISSHNGGLSAFLGNDEVYSRVTDFYNAIRNPVLLNSRISFSPARVTEVYPDSLPNLYKGSQMIVAGRYRQGGATQVTLSGSAFGKPVSYVYDVVLADSSVPGNEFLPKVWAKKKIESLLIHYYALNSSSGAASSLKDQIVSLSVAYGIVTTFTSFTSPVVGLEPGSRAKASSSLPALIGVSSLNGIVTLRFRATAVLSAGSSLRIYDARGHVVRVLALTANGSGEFEAVWDGRDAGGALQPAGPYFYALTLGETVQAGRFMWGGR